MNNLTKIVDKHLNLHENVTNRNLRCAKTKMLFTLHKKCYFPLGITSVNVTKSGPNPEFPADLVTFTEKSLMEHFIFYEA